MKQTAKRILSLVLTLLMLASMLTIYASAANNYVPDAEYYDRIQLDAYVVNPAWASLTEADHLKTKVSYSYRGKVFTETYDKGCHFATLQDAYDKSVEDKISYPVILLAPGTYTDTLKIKGNLTLVGSNAGINPFVKAKDRTDPWQTNPKRFAAESLLAGVIFVEKITKTNVEVKFDGLELYRGFSFIETGARKTSTTVDCVNTIINGAGNASYGSYSATDVFSFSSSTSIVTTVNISNTYVKNLKTSSVVGKGLSVLNAKDVYFTMSSNAFMGNADGPKDQNPTYYVSDSMFYNNKATFGVIAIDPSANDSSSRTSTLLEVSDCVFLDGPDTPTDANSKKVAPINAAIASPKNLIKVHDNWFEGKQNYDASIIGLTLGGSATTNEFSSSFSFNNNVLIGYYNLPNTTGMMSTSKVDFTGNFYADYNRKQVDPVYAYPACYNNIKMDYFYVNQALTVKSTIFEIESFGIKGANVDSMRKTVSVVLDYGKKYDLNLKSSDKYTKFTVYDSTKKNVVKQFDTTKLESGVAKNTFYAVATSPKYPSYKFEYKITVSTFDPATSIKFTKPNTYLLSEEIKNYEKGSKYYTLWDGILYEFEVGKNAFLSVNDVYKVCKDFPTVIIPEGTYTQELILTKSITILGAKHGINPNIPQFTDPDIPWDINPERNQPDQETRLENTVVNLEPEDNKLIVIVDGFTLGEKSGFADKSKKQGSYTTLSVENCISDNAGGGSYYSKENEAMNVSNTIFTVGDSDETKSHKTTRIINFRMEDHLTRVPFAGHYENILFDGCYMANNGNFLFSNEVTAPKGLNFNFEMRNNCFYKNNPSNYYFTINNNSTLSDDRQYNRITLDNNIFYDTTGSGAGIIGIRFASDRDFLKVTNNTFYDPNASHWIPGSVNWYIGKVGVKTAAEAVKENLEVLEVLDQDNIHIKYNRFLGKIINSYSGMSICNPECYWDLTDNYYSSSVSKTAEGVAPTLGPCYYTDSHFLDWDMTKPSTVTDAYNKELNYVFNGANTSKKAFKATVDASVDTYEFDITMNTRQASYKIYTDKAMTNEVTNPVSLVGGNNVFYIKFSSYDGSVSHVYTAVVTKPALSGANIETFGSWKISGTNIYASVPVGTTNFKFPTAKVSSGATYKVYTDYACKNEMKSDSVTVPANYPVVRYIKVVSQDLKTTKIYTVSVVQAKNDQAEIVSIDGATKNGNVFTAPTDNSEFIVTPVVSEGAKIRAFVGGKEIIRRVDGTFIVESIANTKTAVFYVTSQTGVTNTFTLNVIRGRSSSAINGIRNMYTNGGDKSEYMAMVADSLFEVVPDLEGISAKWALYEDAACKTKINGTAVLLKQHTTEVYLKVVSADQSSVNVVKLTIISSNFKDESAGGVTRIFTIKDAVAVEGTTNHFIINATPGITKYALSITASDKAFAESNYLIAGDYEHKYRYTSTDPNPNISQKTVLPITGRNNVFYIRIWAVKGGEGYATEDYVVTVVSPRKTVTNYSDYSKIASWAKGHVDYLNKNGYAYFIGDEKKQFNPTQGITRFEVAAVVCRLLGVDPQSYIGTRHLFSDEIPKWADPYVKAVYAMGIMNGKEITKFDGYAKTTRQEFARVIVGTIAFSRGEGTVDDLYTTYKSAVDYEYSKYTFADQKDVASWAESALKLAVAHYKIMNGSPKNGKLYLYPKNEISRQEVAVVVATYSGYKAK